MLRSHRRFQINAGSDFFYTNEEEDMERQEIEDLAKTEKAQREFQTFCSQIF